MAIYLEPVTVREERRRRGLVFSEIIEYYDQCARCGTPHVEAHIDLLAAEMNNKGHIIVAARCKAHGETFKMRVMQYSSGGGYI